MGPRANIAPNQNPKRHICFSPNLARTRCRRIATRYDKLAANYLAFVKLASIRLWLRAGRRGRQHRDVLTLPNFGQRSSYGHPHLLSYSLDECRSHRLPSSRSSLINAFYAVKSIIKLLISIMQDPGVRQIAGGCCTASARLPLGPRQTPTTDLSPRLRALFALVLAGSSEQPVAGGSNQSLSADPNAGAWARPRWTTRCGPRRRSNPAHGMLRPPR